MADERPALDVLIDQFADDPALLVLDNLEQIVDVAPSVDELWRTARVSRSLRRAAPCFAWGRSASTRSTRSPCPVVRPPADRRVGVAAGGAAVRRSG